MADRTICSTSRALRLSIGIGVAACLSLASLPLPTAQESSVLPVDQGGGEFVIPHVPHLTDDQRREIEVQLERNITTLRARGLLPTALTSPPTLTWPLMKWNGLQTFDYHGISNYVDLDPAFPDSLLDYQCGMRSYDLDTGYNHQGIDIFTWPFPWLMMDNDKVAVVAAAPGTIIYNQPNNPDRSCGIEGGNWNAVYVRHDDGSIIWYGHMKQNSLTAKGAGERVERGEFLGIVGSSGNSTGPHLHMELYDAGSTLTEPFAGPCNNIASWWEQQRPYDDSAINELTTGFAPVSFPSCPNPEVPNTATNFLPNNFIYFTNFYHDQRAGQLSQMRIFRPDGVQWTSWTHSSPAAYYAASYWWWSFNFVGAPSGIWRYEVTYQSRTYERYFSIGGPFPLGRVPQAHGAGTVLSVMHGPGGDITLAWGSTCLATETDYAIYEGTLGDWYSHKIQQCSTGGATGATITPASEDSYYLIVPRNQGFEGSYGIDSFGVERPQAVTACFLQELGDCCGDGVMGGPEVCDLSDIGVETCGSQGFGAGILTCNATCDAFNTSGCTCGNNAVDPPETCDGADLADETCVTQGFDGGSLACDDMCDAFDTTGCTAICGDGVRRGNEPCDGPDLGGQTCASQGFDDGTLTCLPTCAAFDTTGCTTECGDGVRRGNESCDGSDLGGQTCVGLGFEGGTLACDVSCGFDTTGCSACGNGIREGSELCDGMDLGGQTCLSQGRPPGQLHCNEFCDGFVYTQCTGN